MDDAALAIARVIDRLPSNDTFNISYGRSTSVLEIISFFEAHFGYPISLVTKPPFKFDVHDVHLSNEKFKRAYKWEPTVDIENGIAKTIKWIESGKS